MWVSMTAPEASTGERLGVHGANRKMTLLKKKKIKIKMLLGLTQSYKSIWAMLLQSFSTKSFRQSNKKKIVYALFVFVIGMWFFKKLFFKIFLNYFNVLK